MTSYWCQKTRSRRLLTTGTTPNFCIWAATRCKEISNGGLSSLATIVPCVGAQRARTTPQRGNQTIRRSPRHRCAPLPWTCLLFPGSHLREKGMIVLYLPLTDIVEILWQFRVSSPRRRIGGGTREGQVRHNIWTIRTPHTWGPPSPGRTTGHQRQESLNTERPLKQMARTNHSQSLHRRAPVVALPFSPEQSPLRPFTPPPRPDHGDQRAPGTVTGQHSTPTTKPQRGSRGSAGTQSQGRTPPSAARRVTFHDDTDSSQDGPGGRQIRQMSPTAEPQRQPESPRTGITQIPTILPPT